MQGPGSGLRVRTGIVLEEFLKDGPFAQLIHLFLYMQTVQKAQSVLCNCLHPVEARMTRWLLTALTTKRCSLRRSFLRRFWVPAASP
jgi:hypothetical protein